MSNKLFAALFLVFTQPVLTTHVHAENLPWTKSIVSANQHYSIQLNCKHSPTANAFQACALLIDADGKPLNALNLKMDGGMPMHNHGLPTSPEVKWNKVSEHYDIEGLKFSMPGDWVLNVYIDPQHNLPMDKGQFKFNIE